MIYHKVIQEVREIGPNERLSVGVVATHPSGKKVYITRGRFYGDYERVSNFWYWRELLEDGTLGEEEHGYGWQ